MRQPSTDEQALAQWRARLNGDDVLLQEWLPQAGFYKCRAWSRGPLVPGQIWLRGPTDPITGELIGDEKFRAHIAGYPVGAIFAWHRLAGGPIPKDEYRFLMAQLSVTKVRPWFVRGTQEQIFTFA